MSPFVISQILVGLALCTDILSFQFKERKHIVSCLLVSCLLISSHFMILGHWTAAGLGCIAALRFTTSIFSTSRYFMYLFIAATWVVSLLTFQGLLSIIGCVAGTVGTMGSFCKEDKNLRQLMFGATLLWITHNYLAGSPGAVILEIFFASSNIFGYYRFYIRPQKQVLSP
ncbi:YgjV family protein [Desulforhopalus sp. 52FAK]